MRPFAPPAQTNEQFARAILQVVATGARPGRSVSSQHTQTYIHAWFWLNRSSLPNVSKNRRYVGIGCSQRHRVRIVFYLWPLPRMILISLVFVFRILRRAMRGAHDYVRVEISCFALRITVCRPNDAAAFHTILRMMQDCQFSAYGVMTKNLASSKSATLRDKWRLRRYLTPDGKVRSRAALVRRLHGIYFAL